MAFFYVRVECTDLEDSTAPLYCDALIDEFGNMKPGVMAVGWWGNHRSTAVLPFMVKTIDDGLFLDFGSYEQTPQSERYVAFTLFHGGIFVGKRFKQQYGDEWYSFRVKTITNMIEGREFEFQL